MIYLIDDKKLRQEKDFGWPSEKLVKYKDKIHPIYTLDELQNRAKEIFQRENKVFYHESFLDNSIQNEESAIKRRSLEEFAKKHETFQLVIFSGSKNSRVIKKNIAHLPVAVVYQNLQLFLELYKESQPKLEHLAYGANPKIENELLDKLEKSLLEIEQQPAVINNQSCYFIPSFDKFISNPIKNATIAQFFDEEDDLEMSNFININLSHTKFDNIFIPLCYGNSLSDYNGLRLAAHIRCTYSPNQLSRIIIYGFVGIEYLLQNDYFNILKTKNVFLAPFSKQAFVNTTNISQTPLTIEELPNQIEKLKLVVPQNYEDNHSIVNEWAIYRWATTINTEDDAIKKITQKINSNLYFKYLQTIYPISKNNRLHEDNLKIQTNGKPKILYIDDEAEKGWYEVFCKIFYDVNQFDFEYLGDDFKNQTETQIIDSCLKKVKEYNADLVILDFRLHQNDFNNKDITKITSLEILKKIKKHNPGIQVIIFSATNKVWNLQALQNAGADDFIIKESPDLSTDHEYSKNAINKMVSTISAAFKMSFLKKVYLKIEGIEKLITISNNDIESDFHIRLKSNLSIAFKLLVETKHSAKYFNYAYLQLFQIIEDFSNLSYVFKEETDVYVCVNDKEVLVQQTLSDKWESAISFKDGKYQLQRKEVHIKPEERSRRLDTNFKISAILIFRLGFENSSFLKWKDIYTIRNTKAAHFNLENNLDEKSIYIILDFITNFINPQKQKETNINKGLKVKTFEESLELLKSRYKK